MDLTDDRNLYLLLREGDEHAFQTLFKKFYPALCHFANQFLADKEQSEEIVQEIFVKIWEKRSVLNIETSVKHYLFRSVRNQCLNQIQHEKIKKQYATKVLENAQKEIETEQYFLEVDLMEKIEKCIEALPPKRKEIFKLSREQGLKYKEIADELEISVKTVEAQMGLALKFLREELKEYSNQFMTLFFFIKKLTEK